MNDTYRRTIDTAFGHLHLLASDEGLVGVSTRDSSGTAAKAPGQHAILDAAAAQMREYLAGRRRTFELPLAPRGTEFRRRVWRALAEIPYGETTTYGALARSLGQPGAARAVGAANGLNPLWIVVPCHRVVGAGGALTGFAGGLPLKRFLLDLERRDSLTSRAPVL